MGWANVSAKSLLALSDNVKYRLRHDLILDNPSRGQL